MSTAAESSALSRDVLLVYTITESDEEWIARVKARHPGLQIRWVKGFNADGSFKKHEDIGDEIWAGVTILSPFLFPPPARLLKTVRFIQLPAAGGDAWPGHPTYEDKDVLFCTSNGVHA